MELALWADIRVMEETAYMGVYCRRWGVPLIDGGTVRLPRLVGQGRAVPMHLLEVGIRDALCGTQRDRGTRTHLAVHRHVEDDLMIRNRQAARSGP